MDEQLAPTESRPEEVGTDTQPKKRHGCFYHGCLTIIVLVLVAVGGCLFLYQYGKATITPVVEAFLTAAEGGNYDQAYAMTGSEWKQKISRNEFPKLFMVVHNALGARQSLSMSGIRMQAGTFGSIALANYTATYDKGEAELSFTLKKQDGQWQIVGLFYNSPKLAESFKCPNCGAIDVFDAKFCAKCGKPLRQEQM